MLDELGLTNAQRHGVIDLLINLRDELHDELSPSDLDPGPRAYNIVQSRIDELRVSS